MIAQIVIDGTDFYLAPVYSQGISLAFCELVEGLASL